MRPIGVLPMLLFQAFVFLVFVMSPALATPPRVFRSDDRIVAATQSHVYVLRDMVDNLGSHFARLHDQHLVEISLDDQKAGHSWLLRSMAINHLETGDYLVPGLVEDRISDTDDMFAILRKLGAGPEVPMAPEVSLYSIDGNSLVHRTAGPLADLADLARVARAQLLPLAQTYPRATSDAAYRAARRLEVYDLTEEENWVCDLAPEQVRLYRPAGPLEILKITCQDEVNLWFWSFHMIRPVVKK